jgi:hypothetical protein
MSIFVASFSGVLIFFTLLFAISLYLEDNIKSLPMSCVDFLNSVFDSVAAGFSESVLIQNQMFI